jgi:AcrR family transcriptional regulator
MADKAPATQNNEARRTQMLRAAAELICERGFAETRIADVAKRAEASSALVIYYFGTRDRLLVDALRYSEENFYDAA